MSKSDQTLAVGENRGVLQGILFYVMLGFGAFLSLFPFYWMFVIGTSRRDAAFQMPPKMIPSGELWNNMEKVLDRLEFYYRSVGNTLLISVFVTLSVLFFCTLAGYAFAKYDFKGKGFLFILVIGTLMVPQQLSVLPNYVLMSKLEWIDSFKAVIVPNMVTAFGIFWMRQYIGSSVHNEILEAGRIDGCGHFKIFYRIVLPVITPAVATLGIFTFMNTWNDYFWPLIVLKSNENYTIQMTLAQLFSSRDGLDYGMIMSATFFATLPLLVMFLFFSRWFIAGLTSGAVKS